MKNSNCKDKIRFKTKQEAEARAEFESSKHEMLNKVYVCPDCCGYHLTTRIGDSKMDKLEKIYNFKA